MEIGEGKNIARCNWPETRCLRSKNLNAVSCDGLTARQRITLEAM